MKRTLDEHAARFDGMAAEYDDLKRPVYAACRDLVVESADPKPDDIVLDLGTGTGAIALALDRSASEVLGRDISGEMLETARENAEAEGVTNVSFGEGRFREPGYEGPVDLITTNYAMHHLDDPAKREAIGRIAQLEPRRFVLGDVMLFEEADPDEPAFDPTVDDPATVGFLVTALTDCGFLIREVESITDQAGVIVAERP